MLTKKTPDTIKASLTIKAMGVENTIMLTYNNHTPDAYEAWTQNPENMKAPDSAVNELDVARHMHAGMALFVVKSFDDGTDDAFPLTREGLVDLERYWPGTLLGIVKGYHQSRGAAVEKN